MRMAFSSRGINRIYQCLASSIGQISLTRLVSPISSDSAQAHTTARKPDVAAERGQNALLHSKREYLRFIRLYALCPFPYHIGASSGLVRFMCVWTGPGDLDKSCLNVRFRLRFPIPGDTGKCAPHRNVGAHNPI